VARGDDRRGDELELRELEVEAVRQLLHTEKEMISLDTGNTVILALAVVF
jgi:hypothetical protein